MRCTGTGRIVLIGWAGSLQQRRRVRSGSRRLLSALDVGLWLALTGRVLQAAVVQMHGALHCRSTAEEEGGSKVARGDGAAGAGDEVDSITKASEWECREQLGLLWLRACLPRHGNTQTTSCHTTGPACAHTCQRKQSHRA